MDAAGVALPCGSGHPAGRRRCVVGPARWLPLAGAGDLTDTEDVEHRPGGRAGIERLHARYSTRRGPSATRTSASPGSSAAIGRMYADGSSATPSPRATSRVISSTTPASYATSRTSPAAANA
ncbi:hypothetical protein SGLAM104S_04655 [Streptomyces glaucescens]